MKNTLIWAAESTAGAVKKVNEDSYFASSAVSEGKNYGIFAVADGIGGLYGGEIASKIAALCIKEWWEEEFLPNPGDLNGAFNLLKKKIETAAERIEERSEKEEKKMGTTLSVLFIYGGSYYTAHTGDSRIYIADGSKNITALTRDQSKLVEAEKDGSPIIKSVLTDCLGAESAVNLIFSGAEIEKKCVFLICSDGVYKKNSAKEISGIIKKGKTPENICVDLIKAAEDKGETDNITVIAVKAE